MKVVVQDSAIDSVIAKQAKLNELTDAQMDAVKEVVKESIDLGATIGYADGSINTAEMYNKLTQKLVLARTFMASFSSLLVTYWVMKFTMNILAVIFFTAVFNTLAYYILDITAATMKWLVTKSKRDTNDGTGSSADLSKS